MTVLRHPNNNGVTLTQWRKAAAGGETSLSGTDDFSTALSYTVGAEQVFINGVLLERGVDYTATTGTTITSLTALVAGDIATVCSPSSFSVANAIPKATVTAKGDLIVASGASTPTNLAVGADGTTLVANSSASTGVSWTGNQAAGKNAVINGGFDIWQRGTSFGNASNSATAYCADRWQSFRSNLTNTTTTQQSSGLTGFQYNIRVQRTSGDTSTSDYNLGTALETKESLRFAGQTVTLSFYARAGANFAPATNGFTVAVRYGTGTDENIWNGYTGQTTAFNTHPTLTTSWQKFTVSGSISSTATEVGVLFNYVPSGTAGANDYFEVTGVQLELGAAATTFSRAGGTLQGELAACQRYYWRFGNSNDHYGSGIATSTSAASFYIQHPVPMRTAASSIDYSSLSTTNSATFTNSATTAAIGDSWTNMTRVYVSGGSGMTALYPVALLTTSSSGYLGLSAEL
jgi:hypothetical protein